MSTERESGFLQFVCDRCGVAEEAEDDSDFKTSWDELKDNGWRAFKNAQNEWEHRCPDCVGKDR